MQELVSTILVSLRTETTLDVPTQAWWKTFLSNSVVRPKFSPDVSHSRASLPFHPPPPPPTIDNLGFRQIWTQHQKLEVGTRPLPLPPSGHREIMFLADLDSGSKIGSWFQTPPPPPPPPPPPMHNKTWGDLVFSRREVDATCGDLFGRQGKFSSFNVVIVFGMFFFLAYVFGKFVAILLM